MYNCIHHTINPKLS